jgi:putative ATPase
MELFQSAVRNNEPLAARMRPRNLDDFVGQEHILAPGRLLRRAIQADQLSSLIFYGPPGTGKTTLAVVIANTTSSSFETINAVLSGVKQIREAIDRAKERQELYDRRTILFVDEVHRWNKAQQDALLPWVENGTFILIGATTQNPYFEVNSALVSRSRIFQLKPLNQADLLEIARRALSDTERGYGTYSIEIEPGALEHIAEIANGDARSLLNALELAVETTPEAFPPPSGETIHITLETAEESIQKKVVLYDKEGDYHFDTISAFIKSIRGSDPDAALYWMAKMIRAGEDPKYLFRRMLISACEDIGLADPNAIVVTEAAAAAFDRIGLPEGQFHLTEAALYLATAPKSNSSLGYFDALKSIEEEEQREIPNHLRDGSRDKQGFGHGEGYQYPHAFTGHWVAQQYLPKELRGRIFYQPSRMGYEADINDTVQRRREVQLEAALAGGADSQPEEILSFSPPDKQRDRWISRTMQAFNTTLSTLRDEIFSGIPVRRHWRVLDINPGGGLLTLDALRRVPEGGVWSVAESEDEKSRLEGVLSSIPELERPEVLAAEHGSLKQLFGEEVRFELIVGRNLVTRREDKAEIWEDLAELLAPGGIISTADIIPAYGQRLSAFFSDGPGRLNEKEKGFLAAAEELVYGDRNNPLLNWDETTVEAACAAAGLAVKRLETVSLREVRVVPKKTAEGWVNTTSPGSYGEALRKTAGEKAGQIIADKMIAAIADQELPWHRTYLLLRVVHD